MRVLAVSGAFLIGKRSHQLIFLKLKICSHANTTRHFGGPGIACDHRNVWIADTLGGNFSRPEAAPCSLLAAKGDLCFFLFFLAVFVPAIAVCKMASGNAIVEPGEAELCCR